jgi:hypothetical protein
MAAWTDNMTKLMQSRFSSALSLLFLIIVFL